MDQPRISRLAVAGAGTPLSQEDALSLLGLEGDEFAERVFGRSAVATRSLGLSTATLKRTLQGRTARTEDQLFARAVEAVAQLEIDPSEIGTLVTASLYSLGGPTLAHRLLEGFAMDPATDKYHVVGVGCASMVPLVRLVVRSLDDHPGKKAVIVYPDQRPFQLLSDDGTVEIEGVCCKKLPDPAERRFRSVWITPPAR